MPYMYELKRIRRTRESDDTIFELYIPELFISFGEFVAVVGPSGCGKSTLLDLLALVLRPDDDPFGIFHFACSPNEPVEDMAALWLDGKKNKIPLLRRQYIGYVLQTGGLLPFLSVYQNIELACRLKGRHAAGEEIKDIASILEIENHLRKKPQYLSGGERQRVAIARAMIHQPAVVIADEPTASVDSERAGTILDQFMHIAKANRTAIIMATHNYDLVKTAADQVINFTFRHHEAHGKKKTFSTLTHL